MTKITKTVRAAVVAAVAASAEYDAASVRISRDGNVSALKDADKTFGGNDTTRYLLGSVEHVIG